jgi:hypothetical protein
MTSTYTLPETGRIWIYQSDRELTREETDFIHDSLSTFLEQWKAHGSSLEAGYEIWKNHFVIIAVDENFQAATGCSIDDSVKTIQRIGQHLKVDFMDRSQVAFEIDGRLNLMHFQDIPSAVKEGRIDADTMVYNNAIDSVEDWKKRWRIPAGESWIGRYFA